MLRNLKENIGIIRRQNEANLQNKNMKLLEMENRLFGAKSHWLSLTTYQISQKKMFCAVNQRTRKF